MRDCYSQKKSTLSLRFQRTTTGPQCDISSTNGFICLVRHTTISITNLRHSFLSSTILLARIKFTFLSQRHSFKYSIHFFLSPPLIRVQTLHFHASTYTANFQPTFPHNQIISFIVSRMHFFTLHGFLTGSFIILSILLTPIIPKDHSSEQTAT